MENTIETPTGVDERKRNQSGTASDKEYGVRQTMSSQDEKRLVRKIDL
jgi:hypothetical protein